MRVRLALALTLAVFAVQAIPAGAVTVPKNCGDLTVKGKRYTVKAHIVSCSFARRWTTRYLGGGRRPRGYSCRRYDPSQTRIRFICRTEGKDFLAIRG